MLRMLSLTSLVLVFAVLVGGCPQRQQASQPRQTDQTRETDQARERQPEGRVAGTEEQARQVSATIADSGLALDPNRVTAGNVTLNVRNNSNRARTLEVTGPNNFRQQTRQIQPNATETLTLRNVKAGSYQVFVSGMRDQAAWRQTLAVTNGAGAAGAQGGQAQAVNITLEGDRFRVDPATVPAGNITVNVRNATDRAVTFVTGENERTTIQPNQSLALNIERTDARVYRITRQSAGQ